MITQGSIDALDGKHKGKRCWLIGSGPSLDEVKLGKIPKEDHVYCLNASICLFADAKKWPNAWWIFRDRRICQEVGKRVSTWGRWKVITHQKAFQQLKDTRIARFKNVVAYLYELSGVTHQRTIVEDALQLIQFMGFKEVNLVGIDHCVVNNQPYAKNLMFKHCYFYNPDKPPKNSDNHPIEAMVKAMEDLKPRLTSLKVFNTSPYYPRPVFAERTFEESVSA
jgi:hypothetical protein